MFKPNVSPGKTVAENGKKVENGEKKEEVMKPNLIQIKRKVGANIVPVSR